MKSSKSVFGLRITSKQSAKSLRKEAGKHIRSESSSRLRISHLSTNQSTAQVSKRAGFRTADVSFTTFAKDDTKKAKKVTDSFSFSPYKASSFCLWDGGKNFDLQGKRVNAEIHNFLTRSKVQPRNYCAEIWGLAEKSISNASLDLKFMQEVQLQEPYAHPCSRVLFQYMKDSNLSAVAELVSRHPGVLQSVDAVRFMKVQQTPLHVAVKNNSLKLTSFLLDKGLSCDMPDIVGRSPFKIAKNRGFNSVINCMNQHKSQKRRKLMHKVSMEKQAEHKYKIMSILKASEALIPSHEENEKT